MAIRERNKFDLLNQVLLHQIDGKIELAINLLNNSESELIKENQREEFISNWKKFLLQYKEGADFLNSLANGNLNAKIPEDPNRDNYMVSQYKQLQSNLSHLTWQTQQIAKGDLNQRVIFLGELSESYNKLIDELRGKKLMEEKIIKQNEELKIINNERINELKIYYSLSEIIEREGITLEEIYQEFINILPGSFRYPDNCSVRLMIYDQEFFTNNFKGSEWKLSAPIKVNGNVLGILDVFYIEERPQKDEGPFLSEERLCLDGLAKRLGHIISRILAEEDLKEKEERLRLATDAGNIGIWDWDIVKNILRWDNSMYKLYGVLKGDFEGAYDAWSKMLHPEDREFTENEIQAALNGEREYAPEFRIICTDGSIKYLKADSKTIRDKEGNALRMTGTNIDFTDRRKVENSLKVNEQKYRSLFETAHDAILLAHTDVWIDCNSRALEIFGCSREQIIGSSPIIFSPSEQPDGRASAEAAMEKIMQALTTGPQSFEWVHCRYNGTPFYAEVTLNHLELEGKDLIQAIVRDVSKRKMAEEALQENENKLQAIFDTVGAGIIIIEKETQTILEANKTAMQMAGLLREEIINKTCHALICPAEEGKCPVKDLNQIIDKSERRLICAEGHTKDILKTVLPITIRGKELYIESFIDITESKEAEHKVNEQLDELQRWYDATSDREIRILELKAEVNAALTEAGKPTRYENV